MNQNNNDRIKYMEEAGRFQKRQKLPDEDPHAYAGADENSSDSDDEVKNIPRDYDRLITIQIRTLEAGYC